MRRSVARVFKELFTSQGMRLVWLAIAVWCGAAVVRVLATGEMWAHGLFAGATMFGVAVSAVGIALLLRTRNGRALAFPVFAVEVGGVFAGFLGALWMSQNARGWWWTFAFAGLLALIAALIPRRRMRVSAV